MADHAWLRGRQNFVPQRQILPCLLELVKFRLFAIDHLRQQTKKISVGGAGHRKGQPSPQPEETENAQNATSPQRRNRQGEAPR